MISRDLSSFGQGLSGQDLDLFPGILERIGDVFFRRNRLHLPRPRMNIGINGWQSASFHHPADRSAGLSHIVERLLHFFNVSMPFSVCPG